MAHQEIQKAKDIVSASEWEGDLRVNMTTIIGAGRVLAKRVDELEEAVRLAEAQHLGCGGRLTPSEVVDLMRNILNGALSR
jgi:hypothetical protein